MTKDDLISRQAALDVIRPLQTYKLFEGNDMILVDKAEVQTELMMLPSAEPEQGWISVEERLPEKVMQYVLVTIRGTNGIITKTDNWTGVNFMLYGHNVIAWKPFPEPYQLKEDEQ